MAVTGLLKLKIIEDCIKFEPLESLILRTVNLDYGIGLVISVWRNIIKAKLSTAKIDDHLSYLVCQKQVNSNLKDYGYLVFCYLETYAQTKDGTPNKRATELLGQL